MNGFSPTDAEPAQGSEVAVDPQVMTLQLCARADFFFRAAAALLLLPLALMCGAVLYFGLNSWGLVAAAEGSDKASPLAAAFLVVLVFFICGLGARFIFRWCLWPALLEIRARWILGKVELHLAPQRLKVGG